MKDFLDIFSMSSDEFVILDALFVLLIMALAMLAVFGRPLRKIIKAVAGEIMGTSVSDRRYGRIVKLKYIEGYHELVSPLPCHFSGTFIQHSNNSMEHEQIKVYVPDKYFVYVDIGGDDVGDRIARIKVNKKKYGALVSGQKALVDYTHGKFFGRLKFRNMGVKPTT